MKIESSTLSLSQREIFLEYKMAPESNLHTIGGYIQIVGPLDRVHFMRALCDTIRENDSFGIRIHEFDGTARLTYAAPLVELPFLDFSADTPGLSAWMRARFLSRIDILSTPLFEFALLKESSTSHYWFIKAHHVIIDGWGISLLGRSVEARYNTLIAGSPPTAAEIPPYGDFVANDLRYIESQEQVSDLTYWQGVLETAQQPLFAPRAGIVSTERGERIADVLAAATFKRLTDFGETHGVSAFTVLIACLYTYFSRAFLQSDLTFGYPILNRTSSAEKAKVGLFARLLPLRISAAPTATLLSLVKRVGETLRANASHKRCPMSEMWPGSAPARMFDVVVSFERHDYNLHFGESTARTISLSNESLPNPLSIFVEEFVSGTDLRLVLDYNLAYFEDRDAARIIANLKHVLNQCLESPAMQLKDLEIAVPEDIEEVRSSFNATAVDVSGPDRIITAFEEQVRKAPRHMALVGSGRRLTYEELAEQAGSLAERILDTPAPADGPVGIFLDRDCDLVISILAVLKAGHFFLSIDPDYPDHRVGHMLEDSGCELVITQDKYLKRVAAVPNRINVGERPVPQRSEGRAADRSSEVAYIIYTSGSTGTPKGVVVNQAGIMNMVSAQACHFRITPKDKVLQFASFSFDASIFELCMALLAGATLVIAPDDIIEDPAAFGAFIQTEEISIATLPPSYLQVLPRREDYTLRIIITAGEAPRLRDVTYYCPQVEYYNAYGPTESSIWTTIKRILPGTDAHSVVSNAGVPIQNVSVWILDSYLKMMPINHFGEICIGGAGVAQGYLNNDEKTGQHFVQNPYRPAERIYRSGDCGRWLPGGSIELAGRLDEQLKIRGYRIEPGEIEKHLLARGDIRDAAVVGHASGSPDKELAAYVVVNDSAAPLTTVELRRYLQKRLPSFMIPAHIGFVDALPLSHNGKIDRKALAEQSPPERDGDREPAQGATTALEKTLVELWREVLPCKEFGVHDSFFDLGGNSMHAIEIASKLAKVTGSPVSARAIFSSVTISRLAVALEELVHHRAQGLEPVGAREFYEASPAQKQIWVAHELSMEKSLYNVQACYRVTGHLVVPQFLESVRKALLRHDVLSSSFANRNGEIGFSILAAEEVVLPIHVLDFTQADELHTADFVASLHEAVFDLSQAPLARASLLKRSEIEHILVIVLHHLVCDWLSIEIIQDEIRLLYRAALVGEPESLQAPAPAFKDYAAWQNRALEYSPQHGRYWSSVFSDRPPRISISKEPGRQTPTLHAGGLYEKPFSDEIARAVQAKASSWNTTPYTVLFSSLNALLYKYTGLTDIVMGTIVAGRESAYSAGVVGCLMNTLAVRTRFRPTDTFQALADQVQHHILEAHDHQSYPLYKIVKLLKAQGGGWDGAPFSVMVDMLFIDRQKQLDLGSGVAMLPAVYDYRKSKYDLTVYILAGDKTITILYEYRDGVFSPSSIRTFARRWERLLGLLLSDDQRELRSVEIDEASSLPAIKRVRPSQ